jgi:PKHD-type hydroxylase
MTPIVISKIFTKKQCENIISYHSDWPEKIGSIGKENIIESNFRQCLTYIPPSVEYIPNWLGNEIFKTIQFVNKKYYNFDLNEENFQLHILRYDLGGHYETHIDIGLNELDSKRKLSFSLRLNNSYEGGRLRFFGVQEASKNLELGDIIIFPSYLAHKVEPVTSGVRWALVGWILGDKHFR